MRSKLIPVDHCRGIATLELALFAPVLIYMLLAVVDFSRYYVAVSQLGHDAELAAREAAQERPAGLEGTANQASVRVETFCACPSEADVRFSCGTRSCGAYGEPARYVQAYAERPFAFLSRYPGFPASLMMRRKAGLRIR